MRNTCLMTAGTLTLVAFLTITTFADSPETGSRSERSGAVQVFDSKNHLLGTLVGLTPPQPTPNQPDSFVLFRNGYFIAMSFEGKFPVGFETGSAIYWTGPNCTGDPYLAANQNPGTTMSTRMVIWDGLAANSLYVASGAGEEAIAVQLPQVGSAEFAPGTAAGTSSCTNGVQSNIVGWLLKPFDASKALGWNVSGDPLQVQAPLHFTDH